MTAFVRRPPATGAAEPDATATGAAGRRSVTILFSDLSESTKIAGSLEAEEYRDLLGRLGDSYQRIVARHGGEIAQISGDGMLAFFGHPRPCEGDVRRAVETALDLRDAVRVLNEDPAWRGVELKLHSGIHSGRVLFNSGDAVRGRFELLGRPTNIASRLCGLAGPDQVLVSDTTLGPERRFFETSAVKPLQLRGHEEPLPAVLIFARAPGATRILTTFVGREAELQLLSDRLDRVVAGDSLVLEIRAPPGEGKTRLAEEFLRRAGERGCRIHRGECDATAEPLQPFLQIARSIFGLESLLPGDKAAERVGKALAEIDPALIAYGQAWLGLLSLEGEEASAEQAAGALRALFERLAKRGPLILFIDDWQTADDASRAMLAALAGIRSLFVLTAARRAAAGEVEISAGEALALPPLTEGETAEVVNRLLPASNPFLVAGIRNSSGGNPLFIEELCHSIASGRQHEDPPNISSWLDILIESRFSRLTEAQADVARTAAIIGNIIPVWLLELITGRGAMDPLVSGLADEDFIFPGEREGTLRFKHGKTREVIYDSVGLRQRRALHLQIAEALRARGPDHGEEEPYEALAYHYGAGEDAAATAHYAELAGNRAKAVSALDRAQDHYKAALTALDKLPESDETYARWGRIARNFGRAGVYDPSPGQLPIFSRAVEKASARHDRAGLVWAQNWLGYINYALGEPIAAIDHCERALEVAASLGDERLAIRIRAALGQASQAACDYDRALPLLDEAIEAKRRSYGGAGPPFSIAYSLSCKGFALGDMGRFAEAHGCFDEAMAAIGGTSRELEASVFDQRSAVCLWQGRMEEALRFAEQGERLGKRIRSIYDFAMSRALAGYARWKLERAPDAVEMIVEATRWLANSGRNQCISLNYGWLAEIMAEGGRIRDAWRYAARARLRARKRDSMGEAMALRAVARAVARQAGRRPPEHYLARALASARARNAPHEVAVTQLCEAELAFAAGDRKRAGKRLAEARRTFAALDMAWHDREAISLAQALERRSSR